MRGSQLTCGRPWACSPRGSPRTGHFSGSSGRRLKRPLVVGLVFTFGWEQAYVLIFPGYLKYATIAFYLQALVLACDAEPRNRWSSGILQLFNEIPRT